MQGFKPGSRPKDKEKVGVIRGLGTGTSDSIKTEIPRGSYIMPADSTEKIGPGALGALGKSVPAKVSNGEYQMPPEQVHAVGVQALNQVRDATHTPVAAGFKPQEGALYFADGGAVESTDELIARISAKYGTRRTGSAPKAAPEPQPEAAPDPAPQQAGGKPAATIGGAIGALRNRRKQIEEAAGFFNGGSPSEDEERKTPSPGSGPSPQMGALALGNERRVERAGGQGMYQQANSDLVNQAFPNTATAIRGAGQNITESYEQGGIPAAIGATVRNTMVPAIGFAADVGRGIKQAIDPAANALKTAVTGDATPIEGTAPVSPAKAPVGQEARPEMRAPVQPENRAATDYGFKPGQQQGPALDMKVQQTAVPGVNRIDNAPGLNSPLFTNRPTGQAVSEMQGGTVSSVGGFNPNALESMARASTMNAENNQIRQNRMDGRPDDWKRETVSSDKQSNIYQQNKALEQADRARFFADGTAQVAQGGQRGHGTGTRSGASAYEQRAQNALVAGSALARDEAETQRAGMNQQAGLAAAATASKEADVRMMGAKGLLADQQQVSALREQYLAEQDPAKREQLGQSLLTLMGKSPTAEQPNKFTVVPGGQEWDAAAGAAVTRPSRVINNQTGQFVDQAGGQPAQGAPKAGEVRGGYRFKGGNPADQASWEKV